MIHIFPRVAAQVPFESTEQKLPLGRGAPRWSSVEDGHGTFGALPTITTPNEPTNKRTVICGVDGDSDVDLGCSEDIGGKSLLQQGARTMHIAENYHLEFSTRKHQHQLYYDAIGKQAVWQMGPFSQNAGQHCQPNSDMEKEWAGYKRFHAQCRQDTSCMETALIWRCHEGDVCGGVGDEINGLSFSLFAAIASRRPFFISWEKVGQNFLRFFNKNGIDVSVPSELKPCVDRYTIKIDQPGHLVGDFLAEANASKDCTAWITNFSPKRLLEDNFRNVLKEYLPWLEPVRPFYAIGCAMWFLFQPSFPSTYLKQILGKTPSVIHYRIDDSDFGKHDLSGSDLHKIEDEIGRALQCAENMTLRNVLFLAGNEAVKELARECWHKARISKRKLTLPQGESLHVDHDDHAKLSKEAFEMAWFNDFVALQQAEYVIYGGRLSGFSYVAASISFLPEDHFLNATTCKGDRT